MRHAALDRFLSPASFWEPQYVDPRSFWLEHAPFAFWLVGALQPRTIVELGTYSGYSYLCFCQAVMNHGLASTAYAVDTWEGDQHMGEYGTEVLSELASYHDPRYSSFSRLVRSTFDEAAPHFDDATVDLLHLDGVHTYEAVKHDFETWQPKLSARAVVLFHDTNVREQEFGVHRLWAELREAQRGFEFIHGHGLGVLGIGAELPPAVAQLMEAEADATLTADLRSFYARLGGAIARPLTATVEHETEIAGLRDALDEAVAERARLERELDEAGAERARLERELGEAGVERARLDRALAETEAKRGALEVALADVENERQAQESRLQLAVSEACSERDRFAEAARALEAEIAAAQVRGANSDAELAQLRTEFEAVLGSESWRITAPLRTTTFWTRRFVGRGRRVVRLRTRLRRLRRPGGSGGPDPDLDSRADSESPRDGLLRSLGRETVLFEFEGDLRLEPQLRDEAIIASADAWAARNGAHRHESGLTRRPLVSILLPSFNTPAGLLEVAVESVLRQTYTNWELVVVDDGSTARGMQQRLDWVQAQDPRIRVLRNDVNRGISNATNDALAAATGDFVAMLDHDDELLPNALLEVMRFVERDRDLDVVYTDQEYLELDGQPGEVFFKPDWSPTMFCGVMYVGHLLVVRRSVAEGVGGFDPAFDNVQDFEFMLRVSESTDRIAHVPSVLYRWRRVPGSVAFHGDEKRNINDLQAKAVTGHLKRRGIPARARSNPRHAHRAQLMVDRDVDASIAVVLWPGDDEGIARTREGLDPYGESLMPTIVATDAGSWRGAVEQVGAAFVLSLEPGLTPDSDEWLPQLLLHCHANDVGAVSGIVVDSVGNVDESGLAIGLNGAFGPALRGWPAGSDGYAGSLSCSREVSAVSGRCALIRRETLLSLADCGHLFSDRLAFWVDVSLSAGARGLRNVVASQSVFRRELPAREPETSVDALDAAFLQERWRGRLSAPDPYHSPRFARDGGGFRLPADS